MTAAALLRSLDKDATGAPWWVETFDDGEPTGAVRGNPDPSETRIDFCCDTGESERHAPDARLIATTRNLLPEIAALVEAVGEWRIAGERHLLESDFHERLARTENALVLALDNLNAKAAELGGK